MTHPRPAPRARARIVHGPTSKAALHLEAAVDVLAWPISGDEISGQRLGRGITGQLWQRLAELEVATYGEPRPLPRFDVYVGLPPSLHFDPEGRRRLLAREIEARRPENRAHALRRLDAKGRPLYRLSLDGSGRVEAAAS